MKPLSSAIKYASHFLGIASLLAAPFAMAQAPGTTGAQMPLPRPQLGLTVTGCPVFLSASQRAFPKQVETGNSVPAGPAQGLTLTMTGLQSSRITSAEVVAHALSPRNRAVLTSNPDEADITRPFHLEAKSGGGFRSDLWMDGVTSIRWIEVKSITYSNGTVWHESETQRCTVRPDPFVLISAGR